MTTPPKLDYARFSRRGEIMLGAGVVTILFVMLAPLSTFFLDILLCVSISTALLVLVTSMFMISPLEFSVFPRCCLSQPCCVWRSTWRPRGSSC